MAESCIVPIESNSPDQLDRDSHQLFFTLRDWSICRRFWSRAISHPSLNHLPQFLRGLEPYTITCLEEINKVGMKEFNSNDPRYRRKTIALCIAYNGTSYHGYQQQRGQEGILTVEDDLDVIIGRKVVAAGRTDRDVSALSQVVSFNTFDDIDAGQLLLKLRESEACRTNKIAVWSCIRVPRKFHPLFGATWRRYIYCFPLNRGVFGPNSTDVDCNFVNVALSKIEGIELPFNGFAHRENRESVGGNSDLCTLFRAKALEVNLEEYFPGLYTSSGEVGYESTNMALVFELVGTRFLRRMVRILVATAVRESVLSINSRNENILLDIANTRDREKASHAVPGDGLALCGVGYDLADLSEPSKVTQKTTNNKNVQQGSSTCGEHETQGDIPFVNASASQRKRNSHKRKLSALLSSIPKQLTNDVATLDIFDISGPYESCNSWEHFEIELFSRDFELLYYPQRLFSFSVGEIVLSQSFSDVGTTIWDAEVILAHYIDKTPEIVMGKSTILELGAGTGLAAMLCAKLVQSSEIIIQELLEYMPNIYNNFLENNLNDRVVSLASYWGEETVSALNSRGTNSADLILMADVLYHSEHFESLLFTIDACLRYQGRLLLCFEQRRKDLSAFVRSLASRFEKTNVIQYIIPSKSASMNDSETGQSRNTYYYICVMEGHNTNY